MLSRVVPWGSWQLRQSSVAGGCSQRKGPRLSAWQERQLSRTETWAISRRADFAHPIDKYFLPVSETLVALERQRAVVYDASGPRLVDITAQYSKLAPVKLQRAR